VVLIQFANLINASLKSKKHIKAAYYNNPTIQKYPTIYCEAALGSRSVKFKEKTSKI
jgi:hypothetical protein